MKESTARFDGLLRIGQRVKLILATDTEALVPDPEICSNEVRAYTSNIQDVLPDNIVVAWPTDPTHFNAQVSVAVGQKATLMIRSHIGILQLDSEIVAREPGAIPVLHVARLGDWSRSQLRNNVRLQVTIFPGEVAVIWSSKAGSKDGTAQDRAPELDRLLKTHPEGDPIEAVIRDLSAGGVLLSLPTPLDVGSVVRLRFALRPGQPEISTYARVMWIGQDSTAARHIHRAGCQFLNLRLGEQDRIARFIFAKQVEFRRRGLL